MKTKSECLDEAFAASSMSEGTKPIIFKAMDEYAIDYYNKMVRAGKLDAAVELLVVRSPLRYKQCFDLLRLSENFDRDSVIIDKLSNAGYPYDKIFKIINIINK